MKRLLAILVLSLFVGCDSPGSPIKVTGVLKTVTVIDQSWDQYELTFEDGTQCKVCNSEKFPWYIGHRIAVTYTLGDGYITAVEDLDKPDAIIQLKPIGK
jgi:hypothetical protein